MAMNEEAYMYNKWQAADKACELLKERCRILESDLNDRNAKIAELRKIISENQAIVLNQTTKAFMARESVNGAHARIEELEGKFVALKEVVYKLIDALEKACYDKGRECFCGQHGRNK